MRDEARMPDDVTYAASPGPLPSRAEFDALTSRIDAIEAAAKRPAPASEATGDRTAALDNDQRQSRSRRGTVSIADPLLHMSLPAYMAVSLMQAEDALLHREVALHAGDDDVARDLEERAAGLACVALTRATDELQVPAGVLVDQSYSTLLRIGQVTPTLAQLDMPTFRDQEIHLLRLVGLSQELAAKHYDEAFETFRLSTISIGTEDEARKALKAAADAACTTHELLARGRRVAEAARRRRRRLRNVLVALGGAVIAVANPLAVPLIGPVAVGVSVVLGSGAAGAAADVFED